MWSQGVLPSVLLSPGGLLASLDFSTYRCIISTLPVYMVFPCVSIIWLFIKIEVVLSSTLP